MKPAWQIELGKRWSEPHRHHHGVEHLREVLDALDLLHDDGFAFDVRMVRRAAWFHDAVYDPYRSDNEDLSAELARRMLPRQMRDDVVRLVMLTKDHLVEAGDNDGAALCDADLSILGSDSERYARYCEDIRMEYEHVPEPDFRRGRAEILKDLLRHECVFSSDPGQSRWEDAARANMTAEVRALTSPPHDSATPGHSSR